MSLLANSNRAGPSETWLQHEINASAERSYFEHAVLVFVMVH